MHIYNTMQRARSGAAERMVVLAFVLTGCLFATPAVANDSEVGERLEALEERLEQLESQLERAREEARQAKEREARRPVEQQGKMAAPAAHTEPEDEDEMLGHQVFFRGGAAFLTNDRSGEVFTDTFSGKNDGDTGYYVGGGLDLLLTKNTWGMMSRTWVYGEIGVEYKRFSSKEVTQATSALLGDPQTRKVQLTMLTVNIAPKIMFFEGSRLRPWIIPIGLDFHVISPPSNDVTVLDVGGQAGAGLQFNVYKAFNIGIDGRFHLASRQTDTVNNFGTVGGYLGIGF